MSMAIATSRWNAGDILVTLCCWQNLDLDKILFVARTRHLHVGRKSGTKELNNLQMHHYDNKIDGLFIPN